MLLEAISCFLLFHMIILVHGQIFRRLLTSCCSFLPEVSLMILMDFRGKTTRVRLRIPSVWINIFVRYLVNGHHMLTDFNVLVRSRILTSLIKVHRTNLLVFIILIFPSPTSVITSNNHV